jgi:hypothetical protein
MVDKLITGILIEALSWRKAVKQIYLFKFINFILFPLCPVFAPTLPGARCCVHHGRSIETEKAGEDWVQPVGR